MLDLWKKQFNTDTLLMKHDESHIFFQSQWQTSQGPSVYYLFYRWIVTMYLFGTWLLSVIDPKNLDQSQTFKVKYLIYLTNWGYTVCLLQSLICTVCLSAWMIQARKTKDSENHRTAWISRTYKVYWACNTIATDIGFGITVLYWALIYDNTLMELDAQNVFVHGTNSIVMFIELCIVKHPTYFIHCYWPIFFGLTYSIFSLIYYAAGGTSRTGGVYIYPILDWRNGGKTTGICLAVLVFIIVLHCFSSCVSLLRIHVHKKLCKKQIAKSNKRSNGHGGFDNTAMSEDPV